MENDEGDEIVGGRRRKPRKDRSMEKIEGK